MIAEALAEHGEEAVAMYDFFVAHFFKHLRGGGVGLAEGVGEFAVDAAVFFFRGDGQGDDFLFA